MPHQPADVTAVQQTDCPPEVFAPASQEPETLTLLSHILGRDACGRKSDLPYDGSGLADVGTGEPAGRESDPHFLTLAGVLSQHS